jgi:predicted nucleotidyltransferase
VTEAIQPALREAIKFLEANSYRYAVIGGIALAQWGVTRFTHDVDIKVLVPDADYPSIRHALYSAFPQRAREHIIENPFIVAVTIKEVIVDFLLTLPGYEELIIERAKKHDFGGWSAWVCSVEDLIIQKVVAGRGKDWLDVEALLVEQGRNLDNGYINEWLPQFAEALEKPELLTQYRQVIAKVKQLR